MVGDMEYDELINYCMRDAELTYDLSAFDNDLVMNLVTIISRITKLPIEIVTRRAVGGWIESFLMAQHRKRDWLIPRPEDIVKMKGNFATKADVKGKQFQAALVIEPETGVFFPMIVVDYGSLYPSIIKLYNIGYSTICCEHGKEWQNLSIDTKRFIWLLCNLSINKEDDNQCHIEKIMKLMKNIEREIENTKEIIKEKTNNDSMKSNENLITKIWKIHYLKKKERENQKNTEKNLNKTLLDGKNQKIIEMNGNEENAENFYANLLNIKVQNVNNVETLMNELLKYITSMEEMNGKEETFILLLEKWIGKNYNSFAPIVTKLLDMSKCGSNTFAGLPHWLCLRNRAIESEFIGTLRDLRLGHYKALGKTSSWYKCVEQTVKVFMNASYGVFSGRGKFQFYCPIASEEIAQIARSIIIDTVNQAKSSNIKVKGGDTDSLFVHEPNKDKIKVLQDWAKTKYGIDLELDKQFRFMAFSNRKKNYLSVYPDGTVDVKGLTGKKKHTPYFYRTYFEKAKSIVGSIQNENDVERGRKELKALIKEAYICLKQKKSSLRDLAFHVTASKRVVDYKKNIPQHIKAIIQLERAGYTFETGTVVDFIKTYRRSGVIPLELAKASDVDIDKYIEQLITLFEQLLDPFDVTFDEALGIQKMDKYLQ
jgi:DNA polymerase elongation subunit (family B)